MTYYINNMYNDNLYWSNDFGWIDTSEEGYEDYPVFISTDKSERLPIEGVCVTA